MSKRDSEDETAAALSDVLIAHQNASTKRALWQLTNTFEPYFLSWYAMYHALKVSLWLAIPLAALAGASLTSISLRSSLQSLRFRFWDEQAKELVGYAHIGKLPADRRANSHDNSRPAR